MIQKILLLLFFIPVIVLSSNAAGSDMEYKLSELENSTFNRVYSNDDLSARLSRLEVELFGAKQSGNIDKRLDKLMRSAYYCDNRGAENYSELLQTTADNSNSQKGLKSFWSRIKNDFTDGTFTGYTPSMNTSYGSSYYGNINPTIYTPFSSPFYNNKFSRPFDNYRFNNNYIKNSLNNINSINPFIQNPIGISNRAYPRYNRVYHPYANPYHHKPTTINTTRSIGTKVTLID